MNIALFFDMWHTYFEGNIYENLIMRKYVKFNFKRSVYMKVESKIIDFKIALFKRFFNI